MVGEGFVVIKPITIVASAAVLVCVVGIDKVGIFAGQVGYELACGTHWSGSKVVERTGGGRMVDSLVILD